VVGFTVLAQVAIHHTAVTRQLFAVHAMSAGDWTIALAAGLLPVTILEISKLARHAP
jgi:hypothetical protein